MKHTSGQWHVNAIDSKRGRITGDETSEGWDKLQINNHNCTVATVYRSSDARIIASAPDMLAALKAIALETSESEDFRDWAICNSLAMRAIALAEGEPCKQK